MEHGEPIPAELVETAYLTFYDRPHTTDREDVVTSSQLGFKINDEEKY